jgi:galactose mutarotase-like enzyme
MLGRISDRGGWALASRILQGTSPGGLDTVLLQSDLVSLTLVPAAGGKIIELTDRRSGRNWLWRNPEIALRKPDRNADYAQELDSGGWDEVLLSVKPGRIRKLAEHMQPIPDHGDLLSCDWSVDELKNGAGRNLECTMSARGQSAPYYFQRRIRIAKCLATVEFDYRLVNDGDRPLPWYWCAHPLLAVEPETVIDIADNAPMRIEDSATRAVAAADSDQFWPGLQLRDGSSIDLSQSFAPNGRKQGIAHKLFVAAPESGDVTVKLATGEKLTMRTDVQNLPWFGLWINNAAWSGCGSKPYTNLGIEPATTPFDCINEAIENNAVDWLQPGEDRSWSLAVELHV